VREVPIRDPELCRRDVRVAPPANEPGARFGAIDVPALAHADVHRAMSDFRAR
jgi:hypothetical protein